jgi:hypothetical protein
MTQDEIVYHGLSPAEQELIRIQPARLSADDRRRRAEIMRRQVDRAFRWGAFADNPWGAIRRWLFGLLYARRRRPRPS